MQIITKRVNGVPVWQVVKAGQVVCQRWSKAGVVTWIMEQSNQLKNGAKSWTR